MDINIEMNVNNEIVKIVENYNFKVINFIVDTNVIKENINIIDYKLKEVIINLKVDVS